MGDRLMMTLTMRTTAVVLHLSVVMRVGGRGYDLPRRVVSIQWQKKTGVAQGHWYSTGRKRTRTATVY